MSVVESGQWGLALGLVVASLISAGFYLPVIMQMYMRPVVGEQAHQQVVANNTTRVVVAVAAALLIWFGLRPNEMLAVSEDASRDLVSRETLTLERSQAIDPGRP
jgi:NADH:ubiquinone oxidoreductase subunit 2 (subunit N)